MNMPRTTSPARPAARLPLLVALALLATGCANKGGPSLGQLVGGREGQLIDAGLKAGSALTMSHDAEDELGQAVVIAATNRWPLYDRPDLNKYVNLVGLTVATATGDRGAAANWLKVSQPRPA